jgi:hypothetical protein
MLAGAFMLVTGALAKDSWRTVTLGGDPDFTISIPAAVKDYGGGKNPDDLMFFSVTSSGYGSLSCFANRADYPKDSTQTVFAAALATTKREVFCGQNGGTRSGLDIGGSKSFTHNGFQAAICTASYTDSAEKQRGRVTSQMVVAAPRNVYFVTCTVEDEDQEVAEYSWAMLWEESVSHIQQSFHLPK